MICLAGASSAHKGFPTHFFFVKDVMTIWMANRDASNLSLSHSWLMLTEAGF